MDRIYDYTVPVFIKMLGGLKLVLQKAQTHGLDEGALLSERLAPDMFSFTQQVQFACDNAKNGSGRLAGVPFPSLEDNEKSIDELLVRVDKTVEFLKTLREEQFKDAPSRKIRLDYFPEGKALSGYDYARIYTIPNFFFHLTMVYAIIRKNGVDIGKSDYINGMPFEDL